MRSAPEAPYVLWIAVSTVGLLQALASYYGWAGLSFFRGHPRIAYVSAAMLVFGSYYWFFAGANRNVPGLEGWQLFSRFAVGAAAGLVFVFIGSSIINASMARDKGSPQACGAGLDRLKYSPYARLLIDDVAPWAAKAKRQRE